MTIQSPQIKFFRRAFTLVETLIAVSILMFVVLASIVLGSITMRNMALSAQTVQATNLARSQLEKVRNIRDNIWLDQSYSECTTNKWNCWAGGNHETKIGPGGIYSVKENDRGENYLDNSSSSGTVLAFGDDSSQAYSAKIIVRKIKGGAILPFTTDDPAVNLELNNKGKIYLVESEVTWSSYGRDDNKVILRTYLSDWLPRF